MKRIMFFEFLFTLVFGCSGFVVMDYDLWRLDKLESVSVMSASILPKFMGYYQQVKPANETLMQFPCGGDKFILYKDGYFAGGFHPKDMQRFNAQQLRDRAPLCWGRFSIDADTILIQFFEDTSTPGQVIAPRHEYTVQQGNGVVVNDSTILVFRRTFKNAGNCDKYGPGIHTIVYDPPLEYCFVPYYPLPSSDNWLMGKQNR